MTFSKQINILYCNYTHRNSTVALKPKSRGRNPKLPKIQYHQKRNHSKTKTDETQIQAAEPRGLGRLEPTLYWTVKGLGRLVDGINKGLARPEFILGWLD